MSWGLAKEAFTVLVLGSKDVLGGESAEEKPADEIRNEALVNPANANDNNGSENKVEGTVEVSQQSSNGHRGTGIAALDGLGIDALEITSTPGLRIWGIIL